MAARLDDDTRTRGEGCQELGGAGEFRPTPAEENRRSQNSQVSGHRPLETMPSQLRDHTFARVYKIKTEIKQKKRNHGTK
jgi:hypothetical protein